MFNNSFYTNYAVMPIPLKISGFVDYSEKENRLFSQWKKIFEDTFRSFGFMGFNPRPVESIEALQKKGGIAHQIYTLGRLQDGTMTDLALPFDRTVPLAIYVAGHRHELTYPFKRFDISHSFRGERAQAGRFRGFIQADIDVIDEKLSPLAEVECLQTLLVGLKALDIPPFTLYLNHISIPKALILEMGCPESLIPEALRVVDKMDKIGQEKVVAELIKLCPSLQLELLPLLAFKGTFTSFKQIAPKYIVEGEFFSSLETFLSWMNPMDLGLFQFCPGMVRGLDYYTGLVFETFLRDYPSLGSIASGGRYNKLIDSIVEEETKLEGFGLSVGLTRLFDVLKKQELLSQTPTSSCQVLVAYREPSLQSEAFTVANHLRKEGFSVDLYLGKSPIGKQLSYADKKEIPYAFMLMGSSFVIKNLKESNQTDDIVGLNEATQVLKIFFLKNT